MLSPLHIKPPLPYEARLDHPKSIPLFVPFVADCCFKPPLSAFSASMCHGVDGSPLPESNVHRDGRVKGRPQLSRTIGVGKAVF